MVSIREVAKHAGVSISTVSKVLNEYPGLKEETRKKVRTSIEELHYVPNVVASALSSKQSGRVALVLDLHLQTQAVDEINLQYLSGAIQQAGLLGMDVITVFFSMIRNKTPKELTDYFRSQNIAGLLIFGLGKKDTVLRQVAESGDFKAVLVDAPIHAAAASTVWIDHEKAQYEVAKKTILENKGPSDKVLYIYGDPGAYVTGERLKGMYKLQKELRFNLILEEGDFRERKAREITFQYTKDADIIVCASDLMAIGAMRALIEADVFHPVCGFDGITLMAYAGKQMNTVSQNFSGIGSAAIQELDYLLKGGEGRSVTLPHKLERVQYLDMIL